MRMGIDTGSGDNTDDAHNPITAESAVSWRVLWQLGVFFLGFLVIIALHLLFGTLIDQLAEKSVNENARLTVGEEIVRNIQSIETNVYRMAVTSGPVARQRVESETLGHIQQLHESLQILKAGGTIERQLGLNLEGREQMVRRIPYHPQPEASQYVLEMIELIPLLDQLDAKVRSLRQQLQASEEMHQRGDTEGAAQIDREIQVGLKRIPSFFIRLNENANRLFFESYTRLAEFETQLTAERARFRSTEVALVLLVIVAVMLTGVLLARQINEANRKLHRAWTAMRAAKEEAERASRAKSDFVSRMSHELRTPLNAILGFAQLMKMDQLSPTHRAYVTDINKAGYHLLGLINQVLDLAKIEAGHLVIERVEMDLVQTVDEVVSFIAERAHAKGIEVKAFASPALPTRVLGDPTRLREVLINLLGNAVKFTETGEIGVWVEPSKGEDKILFRVWDTGIGIDKAVIPRLFKPFVQADESTTRQYGGTGLGLMICKEIVEAMGGTIDVRSTPGEGSEFRFSLPLDPVEGADARATPLDHSSALVVCRDEFLGQALRAHIESLGAEVRLARSSEQARSAFEEERGRLQVVIVDDAFSDLFSELGPLSNHDRMLRLKVSSELETQDEQDGSRDADALLTRPVTYTQIKETFARVRSLPETDSKKFTATRKGPRRDSRQARVLLVEDNQVNQIVAQNMLAALGVISDIAPNGVEALARLHEGPYDLVLMDVEMPVMDGYTATQEIRLRERQSGSGRIPIIAITANAMTGDRERCIAKGMDDHLAKPFRMEALASLLRLWLPHVSELSEIRGNPDPSQKS